MKRLLPLIFGRVCAFSMILALLLQPRGPALAAPLDGRYYDLALPLLVDGAGGRMYATLRLDSMPAALGVFATRDGRRLAQWPFAGPFALDAKGKRLFVMTAENEVVVLDTGSGARLDRFTFGPPPSPTEPGSSLRPDQQITAAPQYDEATGRLLVFRNNVMYTLDDKRGTTLASRPFDVKVEDPCRIVTGGPDTRPLPITRTFLDPGRRIVYLEFVSYSCIPWIGYTVVAYDLTKGVELSRQGSEPYSALAVGGAFYAMSWHRFGIGTVWMERDGKPVPTARSTGWSGIQYGAAGFVYDSKRKLLYQDVAGAIRVFDPSTMALKRVVPQPVGGNLAGYDPVTDQLYFSWIEEVKPLAAAKLGSQEAGAVKVSAAWRAPAAPVRQIVPAPTWPQARTLFAVGSARDDVCYVFNQSGGPFLRSTDGGETWLMGARGLGGPPAATDPSTSGYDCAQLTSLAVSPAFAKDRTLLAGVKGSGIFRSTDGGVTWLPFGKGPAHMGVLSLALSPGFAKDRIAFATVLDNGLQRSTDGGATWQTLKTPPSPVAGLSPEFDKDQTLVIGGTTKGESVVLLSADRGETWRQLPLPLAREVRLVSLAPAFATWGVLFVGDDAGQLWRSADRGQTWTRALQGSRPENGTLDRMQLAYGPDEAQREVFLLIAGRSNGDPRPAWGTLYRSADGGQTWREMDAGTIPAALAISPNYAKDGLLFVGTTKGEILHIKPGVLQ